MSESTADVRLRWATLPTETRELLRGKLSGLWQAPTDPAAFDSWPIDKQQALLLLLHRLRDKNLWQVVKKVTNIYGEGGVGMRFLAWPIVESTLKRRRDFTRLFANHKDTSGGFYEKGRPDAVLHFLFQEGNPRNWYVHFDRFSPVHSVASAFRHFRLEFIGRSKPDWRMIADCLNPSERQGKI